MTTSAWSRRGVPLLWPDDVALLRFALRMRLLMRARNARLSDPDV